MVMGYLTVKLYSLIEKVGMSYVIYGLTLNFKQAKN